MAHILINEEAEIKIKQALILLEKNNYLSASRAGLEERHKNREVAIAILLDVIDMAPEEFAELYNNSD